LTKWVGDQTILHAADLAGLKSFFHNLPKELIFFPISMWRSAALAIINFISSGYECKKE